MRVVPCLVAGVLLGAPAPVERSQLPRAATSAACTSATPACTEFVRLGDGPSRALIYRTRSLDERNDRIHSALIMVHGTNRNADHYFATATAAAFLAGALDEAIVVAPRIASSQGGCHDALEPNEVSWSCGGDSWRSGGTSASNKDLTSFDFMDAIVKKLADKRVFPNLAAIVIAGHSAGGQFVNRYEMANKIHDTLGIPVTYVVANPSSYAWPDATRATPSGDGAPANAVLGWKEEQPHVNYAYGAFEAGPCPNYDKWPYGLESRTGGYTAGISDDRLKKQLAERPTTYLLSQVDTLPLGGFDGSCSAMAQGATRRARGEAFVKYVNEHLGAKHRVQIVPECGHNDRCVYTTTEVLPVLFPNKASAGQVASAPPPIVMKPLKPDVWVGLGGAGGNSTIIIGKTSVIVVDAKQTEAGGKDLLAEIARITPKPVTTAIITHSDGDHVNGLAAFPAGVTIIAHENNKKEQEAALAAGGRGALPADRLPTRVVTKNKDTMTIDGVKLELYHWAPAHTSGDLIVYLPDRKIVSTGDIVVTNRADDNPNIHAEKNGSTEGWLASVKGMIGLNAEIYVTGHGDVATRADLERKLAATSERRAKIAAMVKGGKTLDEIKAALPDAPAPGAVARGPLTPGGAAAGGGRGGTPAKTFVETAYAELTRK